MGVVLHPRHNRRLLSTLEKETTPGFKDGEDEEGEGPPLVQGGEGQGAKEVLCAHREAARASKEGTRGGKSEVCPHRSPEGKEARPEEQQIRSQSMRKMSDAAAAAFRQS